MSILLHGDCLEELKGIDDDSVDLVFCDLPYGQTSCKWDCPIDLDKFWIEIMRVKKLHTPIFMTTTTKFGASLINSAPKKCQFRYDLVWVKSAPAGFLSAKKMPMRKHEMVYVFYEKLPFYDLSSHQHKFIKHKENTAEESNAETYGKIKRCPNGQVGQYDPPLPNSVVREKTQISKPQDKNLYGDTKGGTIGNVHGTNYDPPLPNSVIKGVNNTYNTEGRKKPIVREEAGKYDPPLPNSVVKEPEKRPTENYENNSDIYGKLERPDFKRKGGESMYKPPLPVSVVKEEYNGMYGNLKAPEYVSDNEKRNKLRRENYAKGESDSAYDPPLPDSMLEIKSTKKGKYHSTEKPVALMEWIFKYYSKEGDVILDPTMGSGSTGVAAKNMNRNFIGIEKDPEIYEVAVNRIEV